ncbi:hypothetical protein [Ligilactobacillus agilis]|uniref:hypothetical protein n=1 Tax=Ligilactobacillus agilis TaxID=1601 RepID=UPI00254D7EE0|nr:hypothetical protein [Ligilactobacillus agilis]MDK6809053.1 hypothetical protein [Ligilactobacillus agilis]
MVIIKTVYQFQTLLELRKEIALKWQQATIKDHLVFGQKIVYNFYFSDLNSFLTKNTAA